MSKKGLESFSTANIVKTVIQYILPILFTLSCVIMGYLAFIDSIAMPGDWRSVTLFGASGAMLSYMIWLTAYRKQYERILGEDIVNKIYSIHKRYYFARKGWKLPDLQIALENAKKRFKQAWIDDVCEMTGRTQQEIETQGYRGYTHKILIFRMKHKLYPKYGVRYARELLQVLNVGYSPNKSIDIGSAERYYKIHATQKLLTILLVLCTTGSIVVEFLTGSWLTGLFKLAVAIISLITSLLFGSLNGYTGANKKLGIAETVAETLEEWKGVEPTEEPYKEVKEEGVEQTRQITMEDLVTEKPITPQPTVQLFPMLKQ